MEQGVETITIFTGLVWPSALEISENDQLEVTGPSMDLFYGDKFRIKSVQHDSRGNQNGQGFIILTMTRNTEARDAQFGA